MTEKQTVSSATEARQGARGTGVRYVLLTGLALVILAFAVIYLVMM